MNDEKNRSKYAKQGPKSSGRPKGVTTINLFDLLERVQHEGINLSELVRDKLREHFAELDKERAKQGFKNHQDWIEKQSKAG
jgi:hypothetical protein